MIRMSRIFVCMICGGVLLSYGCSKNPKEANKNAKTEVSVSQTQTLDTNLVPTTNAQSNREAKGVDNSAIEAIRRATEGNKYVFLFFYKKGDEKSNKMRQVITRVKGELSAKANFVNIDVAEQSAQAMIKKYGIDRAPIPITLVMAPNEAIVTGFPNEVSEDKLRNAFVSPKMAEIVKAIQDRKLVFLLVTNDKMKYSKENIAVVEQVTANELQGRAEVIVVDPRDEREISLLKQCRIDPNVKETMLLYINGGRIMCKSSGRLTHDGLLQEIKTGCSPSGCK